MASEKEQQPKKMPNYMKFVNGGSAGMLAICCVQPLDLLKNRLQMSGEKGKAQYSGVMDVVAKTYKNEGLLAFYNGLSAGVVRQATYTTTRMGIYSTLFDMFSKDGRPPSFGLKTVLAMVAGVVGSFVGTPAEIALIRMSSDGRLPPNERRNYKNVFDAWIRIAKEEGPTTLWRGAIPTMARAMVVNAAQLGTYSQSKEILLEVGVKEGIFLHFCASMISGVATSVSSLPIDILKTRIQNMKVVDGMPEYSGPMDVFYQVVKNEGTLALWKGLLPYYFRIGPMTILTFIFLEKLNGLYFKHVLKTEKSGGM